MLGSPSNSTHTNSYESNVEDNYNQYVENKQSYNAYNEQYTRPDDMKRRRYEEELKKEQEAMRKKMQQNLQQEYENAYYNYLRSLGYKVKERWTWKKTKNLIIAILIIIAIIWILWILPPTHNIMLNFYESNDIVKVLVDVISSIVEAIWQTITGIFTKK